MTSWTWKCSSVAQNNPMRSSHTLILLTELLLLIWLCCLWWWKQRNAFGNALMHWVRGNRRSVRRRSVSTWHLWKVAVSGYFAVNIYMEGLWIVGRHDYTKSILLFTLKYSKNLDLNCDATELESNWPLPKSHPPNGATFHHSLATVTRHGRSVKLWICARVGAVYMGLRSEQYFQNKSCNGGVCFQAFSNHEIHVRNGLSSMFICFNLIATSLLPRIVSALFPSKTKGHFILFWVTCYVEKFPHSVDLLLAILKWTLAALSCS